MNQRTLLTTVVTVQAVLALIDLVTHFVQPSTPRRSERLRAATVGFLLLVTLLFLALQIGGLQLIPRVDTIFHWVQTYANISWSWHSQDVPLRGSTFLLVGVATFYLAGFWDYAVHRTISHSRWFWFTHEYHHLPNQVSILMPGILVRPYVAFATLLGSAATIASIYGLFVLAGTADSWHLEPLLPVLGAIVIVQTASHSLYLRRYWWIHLALKWAAITTPQEHVLHHTWEMKRNYGNFTTIWDRLFGTYVAPTPGQHHPQQLGLPYDQDFLGTLTIGLVKLPPTLRRRFQLMRFCNVESPETPGHGTKITEGAC